LTKVPTYIKPKSQPRFQLYYNKITYKENYIYVNKTTLTMTSRFFFKDDFNYYITYR